MLKTMGATAIKTQDKELCFNGLCQTNLVAQQVVISIDEIANNRDWQNISGTLSVELWALTEAYDGGNLFQSEPLASTTIGVLSGQHCLRRCRYELIYAPPVIPSAEVCLMLREWQGEEGYVTKDYLTLSSPQSEASTEDSPATAEDISALNLEYFDSPESFDEAAKVSINTASLKELRGVKGIDKKLAKVIVSGRPYRKKKALLQLPTMSGKKFKKIKRKLRK